MLENLREIMEYHIRRYVAKLGEVICAIEAELENRPIDVLSDLVGRLAREKEALQELLAQTAILSDQLRGEELAARASAIEAVKTVILEDFDYSLRISGEVFERLRGAEAERLFGVLEEYKRAAEELSDLLQESAEQLKRMEALSASCEGSAQYQAVPPPPVMASAAAPAANYSVTVQPRSPEHTAGAETESKGGIFGLFKRKKKGAGPANEGAVPPPCVDSVQFSAVSLARVEHGKYLPVNILMYEDAFRKVVDDAIRAQGETAKEAKGGYHDVERNSTVRVVLTSRDVEITDGEEEQIWNGKYLNFEFAVKVPADFSEEQILLSASVYINGIIATKLKLIVDCEKKAKRNISVTREDVASAFVSYASQDRNRVAAIIQGMKKARPDMDIFFDIESLRSGQNWEDALKSEIESRDVLFLCWSRYAKESKWVEMEWKYALENKGEESIEPIPIDSPDVCPPPTELQQKHFNDKMLFIIKATAPQTDGRPCLVHCGTKERLTIDKPLVLVGKGQGADLLINGNSAISRSHAEILRRDGAYYVKDLNSTNHTYVDGQMLQGGAETLLCSGARLRFADEEFEFYC